MRTKNPEVEALRAKLLELEASLTEKRALVDKTAAVFSGTKPPPMNVPASGLAEALARAWAPERVAHWGAQVEFYQTEHAIEVTKRELAAVIFRDLVEANDPDALACNVTRVRERVKEHLRAAQEAWRERADGNEARRQRELAARVISAGYEAQWRLRERVGAAVGDIPVSTASDAFGWIASVEANTTPAGSPTLDKLEKCRDQLEDAQALLEKPEPDEPEAEPGNEGSTPSKVIRGGIERDPRRARSGRALP